MNDRNNGTRSEKVSDYVVFDFETTGLSSAADRIIEISAIRVEGGQIVGEFSMLVDPEQHIPYGASMVNHITDDMVRGQPTIAEALPAFLSFIGKLPLVGHNIASFDMKFLNRACMELYGTEVSNDFIDTLRVAKMCFPEMQHRRLTDLAEHYGLSTAGAHRALADCRMNQIIYERMKAELKENAAPVCPRCGNILIIRSGRFGKFYGCSGFPRCRFTKNIPG